MGLFGRRNKGTLRTDKEGSEYEWMTIDEALALSRGETKVAPETLKKLAGELCDQMIFLKTGQEQTKEEYRQVTEYLADLQRYENMDEKSRAGIADAARMILSLDAERVKYQTGEKRLSLSQYHTMETYESDFPEKLSELRKHEEYLSLVRSDMRNIEGEKGSIGYEKESAEGKKNFLNKLSYGVIFLVLLTFIVLIVLADRTGKDLTIPFFLTGIAALFYIFYYLYAIKQCKNDSKKSDYMMSRANVLLNKVKIKYVNTTNVLEYAYDKYGVNSVSELEYIWENYKLQKEEEKKYLKNTQMLNSYTTRMTDILLQAGMKRADTWVHQPEVLLDRGEFADFRDAVSKRRNKLRAQLDFSLRQQDSTMNDIQAFRKKYAGFEDITDPVFSKNGIEI